jgi:hypothetical protein
VSTVAPCSARSSCMSDWTESSSRCSRATSSCAACKWT